MPTNNPEEPLIPALATPSFAPDVHAENTVLSGPLGLRSGWGLLFFFLLSALLGTILFVGLFSATGRLKVFQQQSAQARTQAAHAKAAHQPVPQTPARLNVVVLSEAAQAGAVLLAAFGLRFVEKRRFCVYGLGSRYVRDLFPGAITGIVSLSALVAVLRGLHLLVFDGRLLYGAAALRYGLGWLLAFAMVGLFEEYFFRGYIQFTLMRGILGLGARLSPAHAQRTAFWMAAIFWSLLFSATHLANAGEDPMGLAMVFVAGMLFSYALWRTGSLWWGIGFHMTWDWGQSFLYGVPDSGSLSAGRLFATHAVGKTLLSGGNTGPEGSVYVLPILLLVAGVIRLHPQRPQPPVEPEALPLVPHSPEPRVIP